MTAHFANSFEAGIELAPGQGQMSFAKGTRIATTRGEVVAETLTTRHRVLSRDAGVQRVARVGAVTVKVQDASQRPVTIRAGALGQNLPQADLTVPPTQQVLVFGEVAAELFGADEVFVEAAALTVLDGVSRADVTEYEVVEVLFAASTAVLANGAWVDAPNAVSATAGDIGGMFPGLAEIGMDLGQP